MYTTGARGTEKEAPAAAAPANSPALPLSSQRHLLVAADTWMPWFSIQESDDGSRSYTGIMWEVVGHLSRSLNFTFEIVRPPDGKWGSQEANGSWNGMVGMLHRGEVDMALGPLGITRAREEACDFSSALAVDEWSILVRAPDIAADPLAMTRPFDSATWAMLCFSALAVLATFVAMNKSFGAASQTPNFCGFVARVLFSESTTWSPDAFLHQRALTTVFLAGIFILAQGYSGTLVSMFAAPAFHVPINSLDDLVNQGEMPWGMEAGSMLEDFGKVADAGSPLRRLYEGAKFLGLCAAEDGKISSGEFAETCLLLDIYAILSDDFGRTAKCGLHFAQETFLPVNLAIAVQTGSPLLPLVNREVLSLVESGLPTRWLNQFLPNKTDCDALSKVRASKTAEYVGGMRLGLVELAATFLLAGICLCVSVAAFAAEMLISWHQRREREEPESVVATKYPSSYPAVVHFSHFWDR